MKINGVTITSKSTGIQDSVGWKVDNHESWIQQRELLRQVCRKVFSAQDAISRAQRLID